MSDRQDLTSQSASRLQVGVRVWGFYDMSDRQDLTSQSASGLQVGDRVWGFYDMSRPPGTLNMGILVTSYYSHVPSLFMFITQRSTPLSSVTGTLEQEQLPLTSKA